MLFVSFVMTNCVVSFRGMTWLGVAPTPLFVTLVSVSVMAFAVMVGRCRTLGVV